MALQSRLDGLDYFWGHEAFWEDMIVMAAIMQVRERYENMLILLYQTQ